MSLLSQLKIWRGDRARKEGVEVFRVLPNRTLEEIARLCPMTQEELLNVHGIGEKKVEKYGEEIFAIVRSTERGVRGEGNETQDGENRNSIPTSNFEIPNSDLEFQDVSQKIVSVGEFLDRTNAVLAEMPGAIRGEVSSADVRERYVFFTLKDAEDNASLSIFMWRREYDLCGVDAREGVEVIVRGRLEVYKPSGRLSFRAHAMELVGEGAIKAAYDRLKKKLEEEGFFAPEKKRTLSEFPYRIGIITSREGAVIHDFMSNIGRFGFKMFFVNSRVEGALAVEELLRAMRTLKTYPIDVLVLIRGGGSMESLAAFNNEMLVREIASFPVPVLCGIGHDKDVPLASLAADMRVSTPTATTRVLNASWEKAVGRTDILERDLMYRFERELAKRKDVLQKNAQFVLSAFSGIFERCRRAEERMQNCFSFFKSSLLAFCEKTEVLQKNMLGQFGISLERTFEKLHVFEQFVLQGDPRRQLNLGYVIISHKGKIVRSVREIAVGEEVSLLLSDGSVEAKVCNVTSAEKL